MRAAAIALQARGCEREEASFNQEGASQIMRAGVGGADHRHSPLGCAEASAARSN